MSNTPLPVAIIGAGPAGLAAAHRLSQRGVNSSVLEANAEVGGLARSLTLWGRRVDIGPHIFSGGDREALALWDSFAGNDASDIALRRGIVTNHTIIEFPPRALDLLRKLPLRQLLDGAVGLAAARLRGAHPHRNAEELLVARLGRPLYESLVAGYLEKMWGVAATQIHTSFAESIVGSSRPGTNVVHGREREVTAAGATFRYPRDASSGVWTRLAAAASPHATVEPSSRVDRIVVENGVVRGVQVSGEFRVAASVISTMPLSRLIQALGDAPEPVREAIAGLRARNYLIVHLLVERAARTPYLWLYAYDRNLRVGRVSDRRNWFPNEEDSATIITMEYWTDDADPLWTDTDAALVARATSELAALRVFGSPRVLDGRVMRLRGAIPVPTLDHADRLAVIGGYLGGIRGLVSIGRHGGFAATSMAHVMGEGLSAADAVLASG